MSRTPKSQSLSRSQSSNKFFQDNAIKPPPISKMSSYSTHNIQNVNNIDLVNHYSSTRSFSQTQAQIDKTNQQLNQQLNSTGFGNSKSRLNPKQFLHREVFNTKLYQNQEGGGMKKYFKIQLPKNQREQVGLPQPFGEYLKQYTKTIAQNNYHQNQELKKLWKTILHHIHLLQKNTFMIPSTQPIKLSLKNTLSSLQSYLLAISAHIVPLQNYKKQQELNILNLQRKKEIVTEHQLKKLEQLNSSRLENQMNEHNIINKYKSKLNYMDFQLKKYVLRVQKLEEELSQMKDEIKTLRQSNLTMKKERQNIQKWKQDYQYKIKKLREELEVAHIVKQQNLQDKFNYILGWKL